MQILQLDNQPDSNDLWKGIGGHFDSFSQIICEFVDNAISNFIGNNLITKSIIVTVCDLDHHIEVVIEDSGTGIKNLAAAFCIGNKSNADSPLNEHGFGMKHALAAANTKNDNWIIYTRTKEDFKNQQFKKIKASYKISNYHAELTDITEENWPGELNGSGTYIKFSCTKELFNTVRKGIQGRPSNFDKVVEIFLEELGFIYSGIIANNVATIVIKEINILQNTKIHSVRAVLPSWKQYYAPGSGTESIDLGGGTVKLNYAFGEMATTNNYKFYKRNMSSSGLEIRIDGRLLEYNLFKEIWGIEQHNKYNHLLITVDIVSNNSRALPVTRTSKNGLREGDVKFENILQWVREKMPTPSVDLDGAHDEADLFEELEKAKKTHLPDPKTVTREQNVYKSIAEKVSIDLYVHFGKQVIIYEGKKDISTIKDVYQLRLYWDGCIIDGIQPTKGILISSRHPNSVKQLVEIVNQMKDYNNCNYDFILKTWKDEGVNYPKS